MTVTETVTCATMRQIFYVWVCYSASRGYASAWVEKPH